MRGAFAGVFAGAAAVVGGGVAFAALIIILAILAILAVPIVPARAADVAPARRTIVAPVPARQVVVAPAPVLSGYLEGFGGASWFAFDEFDDTGTLVATERSRSATFGGALRVAAALGPVGQVQGDGWLQRDKFSGTFCAPPGSCIDDPHFQDVWGVGGHASFRHPGGALIGALASFGANANTIDGDTRFFNLAGEALAPLGHVTLYGQAGMVRAAGGALAGEHPRAWYVHGEVRLFATPNLMIAGNAGFARYSLDDVSFPGPVVIADRHADIVRWGARVEYKFAAAPLSLFVAYQGGHVVAPYTYNGSPFDDRIRDTYVLAGLRLWLHQQTLQGNDSSGATLTDWNPVYGSGIVIY